jgi:pyruvate dehydrogenase E2 component (dihydrolipoamide acetyltransferase)/2-oxoisovalerate dehydrogenase E2 component (dihydrolipoyl transacylase)
MDFSLPELGEGVYEAELLRWLVKPGDTVKRGQTLMEVMTDKATMEVPSPFAGTINTLRAEVGNQLKVGAVVLTFDAAGDAAMPAPRKKGKASVAQAPERTSPTRQSVTARANGPGVPVKAAPSVRYMARKLGVDIDRIRGSGPQGRILIEDLTTRVKGNDAFSGTVQPAAAPKPNYGTPGTRVKLQGLRRVIAERMVQSKQTIPHYTYVDECDVTELVCLRDGLRDGAAQIGLKVTYLAFVAKAVVAALQEVPIVNATLDEKSGEIVLHDHYHLGIAVATPSGLMVPVLRDADKNDLFQMAREIERLMNDAKNGKAKLADLRGSTFTITSIGNIGGLFATPIINPPEVGILGVGKIVKRPVFDAGGQVKAADMVYLSLSFDHRVVDGAVGAAFGNAIMRNLQNPMAMLIPVQPSMS